MSGIYFLRLVLAALAFTSLVTAEVKFNRDIRPIMSDTCFRCHGPDKKSRMAGLRLDIRDEATRTSKAGVTPIVPGDPEKSAIIQRVFATNPAKIMPPVNAHKDLRAEQKNTIRRWIAEGAKYEGHWAYEPVKRPTVPQVAGVTGNAIDAFIRERLAREGLSPSPEADRRTLLRRVTFDLIGLPPTPEEMNAFLKDTGPRAYETVVDKLLSSPRYAELQTMRWLDAVRYADSSGFHGDNLWPAWPYRDYVLGAFRDNKPFDQFTREQLAGDLLPEATTEQKIASAFNRLNRASAEGGLQPKEYLAKYGADRVRTVSTVWLGSTMGCAECHDHKFDPFTAKDFYSMKAFFADVKETGLVPDRGVKAWGSKLMLPSEEQRKILADLDAQIADARKTLEKKTAELDERRWSWEEQIVSKYEKGELAWHYQRPISAESLHGAKLKIYNEELVSSNFYLNGSLASERKRGDGLVIAEGPNPDNETYTVQFKPGRGRWTAFGIDVFQDESLPGNRVSRGADRFVLTEVEAEAAGEKLGFVLATSHGFGELPEHGAMAAIDGNPRTGWAVSFGEARNPFLALRLSKPLVTDAQSVVTVRLQHDSPFRRATIGRFRLALSAGQFSWPETGDASAKNRAKKSDPEASTLATAVDKGLPPEVVKALHIPEEERTADLQTAVIEYYRWAEPDLQPFVVKLAKLEAERGRVDAEVPRSLFTERARPRATRILPRGNFLDESGEIVQPAIPAFLGRVGSDERRANRLDLANWVVSPQNPLTARVYVNRVWRQFFGTGLSKILEDVGSQGELPTHPELLDWLAAEFMQPSAGADNAHSWDMKHIVRTIVMSDTYRQSSLPTPAMEARDADNRLLARQNRFRVDAEVVHDVALAVSGLLVNKFGGPSVRPVQPEGYLAAMNFPKREYSESRGEDQYRRALYTQWQRTFLHPSLLTFDAPTREECTVNRVNSNTPLQALVLLNDPIFVEVARVFAENILRTPGKWDGQIDWAFDRALNRAPGKEERKILAQLYKTNLARFRSHPSDADQLLSIGEAPLPAEPKKAELAAMTMVARALLNLHETIARN